MNKAYFKELAVYNSWANRKVMNWLAGINEEQWNKVNHSSFSSVRQTAIHLVSAEKIWTDFWKQAKAPVYLSASFAGSKEELIAIWAETNYAFEVFMDHHPETELSANVSFIYPDGRTGQMSYEQSFAHIVNHSTYHRGQLVTLLRQAGFSHFSSVDLATYYLSKQEEIRAVQGNLTL